MNSPNPRYREAELALWGQPGTYRGFVRTELPYRAARRLRAPRDRVEPYLARAETERVVDALANWFDVRWEGDVVVAQFPEPRRNAWLPGPLNVRLENGDLPMFLGKETSHWVGAGLAADVQVPTTNVDSPELDRSFDAWAEALRRCGRILRGDVGAFEAAVRRANRRRGR